MNTREIRIFVLATLYLLPILTSSYVLFLLITTCGAGMFLVEAFRIINYEFNSRFLLLSSISSGIWLSLATIVSFSHTGMIDNRQFINLFGESFVAVSVSLYSVAFLYSIVFIISLCLISRLKIIRDQEKIFSRHLNGLLSSLRPHVASACLLLLSVALFFVNLSGIAGVRGINPDLLNSGSSVLPWWFPVFFIFLRTLPLLLTLVLIVRQNSRASLLTDASLIIGFIVLIYYGISFSRFTLVSFISLVPIYYIVLLKRGLQVNPKSVAVTSILFLMLFLGFQQLQILFAFINTLRAYRGESMSPTELVSMFVSFSNAPDVQLALSSASENLSSRPLTLWPLAASIGIALKGSNLGWIGLQDIISSFYNSLPSFLIPFKGSLLLQEGLLYKYFPLASHNIDTADSPFLFSFASLGAFGVMLYPLVIALIYFVFMFSFNYCYHLLVKPIKPFALLIALSSVGNFAIISFTEMATTALYRSFIEIILIIILLLFASFFLRAG